MNDKIKADYKAAKDFLAIVILGGLISLMAAQKEPMQGATASLGFEQVDSSEWESPLISKSDTSMERIDSTKTDAFHAGADEKYPDVGYDADGWSLRGYMSCYELSGKHLKGKRAKRRFGLRKAKVQRDFIDSMSDKALDIAIKYDVPPSVIVAQAYIESAFGTSRMAVLANNHFGMQYRGPKRGLKGKIHCKDRDHHGRLKEYDMNVYETTWWDLYYHAQLIKGLYGRKLLDADVPLHTRWAATLCGCNDSRLLASDAKATRNKGGKYYAAACEYAAKDGKTSKYVATVNYIVRLFNLQKLDAEWLMRR